MGRTNVRLYVAGMYDSDKWRARVSKMSDRQCYAIYRRNEEAKKGRLYFPKKEEKNDLPWPIYEGKQLSLFDL